MNPEQYTFIVKHDGERFVAICYEEPSVQCYANDAGDAIGMALEELEYKYELPPALDFEEALETVGL